ncbi:glycosyltransferase family 39 protein [Flavobacterium selenitireducens]|uniref:glycosyltransferase family 39 protein n=1 Tax=Flavobacterium selenitireducens TaxID=2722704 RepID=UPI00168B27C5|nr:glycosyltransferase family 39 protein [Flavobacterium selenitireducens]MBD3583943.1 glycosyltransferase family 39 protein [Flavobacterium selenitireducens]
MKRALVLLLFVIVKFGLTYALVDGHYELHRDEFLHLDQGAHPAFGYLSVPPFTSWISMVIHALGDAAFWVRFFPCLFGALTIAVVWKAIEALGGGWFALILGACSVLFSALLRLNMLFQPNSFEVLAWTFTCFALIRYVQMSKPIWLYAAFLALGFGFLNKYNIAILSLGLCTALVFSPFRTIFSRKHFRTGLIVALVVIAPNLIWQVAHGFPVVRHMRLLRDTQLVNVSTSDFFKEQLLFFFGSIHVVIAALAGLCFYKPLKAYRFFAWSFAITLVLFALLSAKGYYAIALYPIYIAFGSLTLEKRLVGKAGLVLRGICIAIPIGGFLATYPIAFPVSSPEVMKQRVEERPELHLARWEDGRDHDLPQDFADMLGWKELAQKVDSAIEKLPASQRTIVLCDNYGQAGAINYYSRHKLKAVTMNADYLYWFELDKPVANLILVQEASDDDPERKRERSFFESVEKTGTVINPYAREKGTSIYLLRSAKVDINSILESEIQKEKSFWED